MQDFLGVWSALDVRRRIILAVAIAAVVAAVLALSKLAAAPRLELLYAGLEPAAAGQVVAALDQQSVSYEIRGTAIYVDADRRDALRLTLAGEGLPSGGAAGYELLDDLSGFGTTSQMFDAAYWRAKEGELARTIMSSSSVRAARVHISVPNGQVFRQESAPSASVFVTGTGAAISADQANALRYLVASAVSGLQPSAVSVIDGITGVALAMEDSRASAVGDTKRAEALRRGVERLLWARVGPGNAVVEINLDSVTDRESIVERQVDPTSRVAISSETEERSSNSEGQNGTVTVAGNLPDGDATARDASSQNTETREIINYEVSQTEREILREPGGIRRLTVAVLVDGTRVIDQTGVEVFAQRSPEELQDLGDLVKSAVGYDEARGDQITIKSLEFEPSSFDGSAPIPDRFGPIDIMSLIQIAVLSLVALALGLFVVRPILTGRKLPEQEIPMIERDSMATSDVPAVIDRPGPALDGEIDLGDFSGAKMALADRFAYGDEAGLPQFNSLETVGLDPVARLKRLISERQDETIEVLRSWMEDDREKT